MVQRAGPYFTEMHLEPLHCPEQQSPWYVHSASSSRNGRDSLRGTHLKDLHSTLAHSPSRKQASPNCLLPVLHPRTTSTGFAPDWTAAT